MATVQTWVDATRKNLLSSFVEQRNKLDGDYTAGSGTITFKYPMGGIQAGSVISCGRNTFYVWETNGQTAKVDAGIDGSTDSSIATGSVVRVNPRFTDADIWQALSFDLADLESPMNGLFGIKTVDFAYNAHLSGYDIGSYATDIIDIYEVKYLTPGPYKDNPRMPKEQWELKRNVNTAIYPSGTSFELKTAITPGYNFRIVYKSKLVMPTDFGSDLSTVGLPESAYDIPPLGAAIRLMAGREIKRNFTESQGENRRPTEVPPGAVMQSANALVRLRKSRIDQEAASLALAYPPYWND